MFGDVYESDKKWHSHEERSGKQCIKEMEYHVEISWILGNNCGNVDRGTTEWAVMVLVGRALNEVTRNSKNGDWKKCDCNIPVLLEAAGREMCASASADTNKPIWDVTKLVFWCDNTSEKRSSNPDRDTGCAERSLSWVSSIHPCKFCDITLGGHALLLLDPVKVK